LFLPFWEGASPNGAVDDESRPGESVPGTRRCQGHQYGRRVGLASSPNCHQNGPTAGTAATKDRCRQVSAQVSRTSGTSRANQKTLPRSGDANITHHKEGPEGCATGRLVDRLSAPAVRAQWHRVIKLGQLALWRIRPVCFIAATWSLEHTTTRSRKEADSSTCRLRLEAKSSPFRDCGQCRASSPSRDSRALGGPR
jgi:hypothetical protein